MFTQRDQPPRGLVPEIKKKKYFEFFTNVDIVLTLISKNKCLQSWIT